MKKSLQNIIVFLLLIAGLTIFLHSVIPHDHHYNQNCDINHHQHPQDDENTQPVHCHLFNEIIVDKAITSHQLMVKLNLTDLREVFVFNFTQKISFKKQNFFIPRNNFSDYFVFLENTPTRGSPNFFEQNS